MIKPTSPKPPEQRNPSIRNSSPSCASSSATAKSSIHPGPKYKAWIKLTGCHSRIRRKYFEATEQSPRLVAWILRQVANLYHIEKRLRETQAGPALRQAVRAAESRMIYQRLKKALDKLALRKSILPKSKLGKAISYAINQWSNLETSLSDGRVEICNNLAE